MIDSQRTEVIRAYEREFAKGPKADQTFLKNLKSIHPDCEEGFRTIERQHQSV